MKELSGHATGLAPTPGQPIATQSSSSHLIKKSMSMLIGVTPNAAM